MANKILHTTIMQKNTSGDRLTIYPKTVTKNIIDGSSTLDQTLNTLKSADVSNKTTTFTQASTRENLVSGETLATSHGKIMKLISDLKSLAFADSVGVSNLDSALITAYNDRVTTDKVTTSTSITTEGYVADARAVNNLQNQINSVYSNIGTIAFRKSENEQIADADSAPYGLSTIPASGENSPFNFWSTLIRTGEETFGQELALPWSRADKNLKYRVKDSGVWEDWQTLLTDSDIRVQNNTDNIYITPIKDNVITIEPQNTYYAIRNDFCFVSLSGIQMTSTTGGYTFKDLPTPIGRVNFTLHRAGLDSKPVIWGSVDGSRNIHFNDINSDLINVTCWGSFCYPIYK